LYDTKLHTHHKYSDSVRTLQIPFCCGYSYHFANIIYIGKIHINLNTYRTFTIKLSSVFFISYTSTPKFSQLLRYIHEEANTAIHIGFLDFTPFPDIPEFYTSHKLMTVKSHHIYSSKFILNVLDLTQIDLATEDDKAYRIDYWARLFKARTWEELKMIAEKDENLCEASESLYVLNADDITRQKCRARRDALLWKEKVERKIDSLTRENESLTQENESLKRLLEANNISYEK